MNKEKEQDMIQAITRVLKNMTLEGLNSVYESLPVNTAVSNIPKEEVI